MTPKQIRTALGKLESLWETAEAEATAYNEAASELAADIQAYVDDKSERWQEGETGSAYTDLISELENLEAEVPEVPYLNL